MEKFVSIERAIEIARQTPLQSSVETIPIQESLGRILANDLPSKVDDPAFDNSAMDGWAVRSQDKIRIEIGQTSAFGDIEVVLDDDYGMSIFSNT